MRMICNCVADSCAPQHGAAGQSRLVLCGPWLKAQNSWQQHWSTVESISVLVAWYQHLRGSTPATFDQKTKELNNSSELAQNSFSYFCLKSQVFHPLKSCRTSNEEQLSRGPRSQEVRALRLCTSEQLWRGQAVASPSLRPERYNKTPANNIKIYQNHYIIDHQIIRIQKPIQFCLAYFWHLAPRQRGLRPTGLRGLWRPRSSRSASAPSPVCRITMYSNVQCVFCDPNVERF